MSAMSAPAKAMVLAAGLGTRMRPITDHTPKPLVAVAGRTMLDRALDHLAAAGVAEAVVNIHHLPDAMRAHLAARPGKPRLVISDETDALLETGGGVTRALPLLGDAPVFVVNADILWLDGPAAPALARLAAAWEPAAMDALLLLTPTATATGYDGAGDFFLGDNGVPERRGSRDAAPFVFAGVQILTPAAVAAAAMDLSGAWSLNRLYDRLLAAGRLRALAHDGAWFHVGTPEAIAPTEAALRAREGR